MTALCRDCLTLSPEAGGARCGACGRPRILSHPELSVLSIAHVDCDAFYATVEKRDDPSLADKPLIIGGGRRGVVSTACYIARTYGVKSAMPMFKALALCPDAVVLRPDMAKYVAVGRQVRQMMRDLTPLVEPLSIDEAFLDLSGTERLHRAPPALTMARFAQRVERDLGITVSVGLSYCKFLAKIASDLDKPRGFAVIGQAEALDFLADKPVSVIWGVGQAFAAKLDQDGFRRIRDLRTVEESRLVARYGDIGRRLHALAHGRDARLVSSRDAVKSVSAETTFDTDIADGEGLRRRLWALCEKVAARAKTQGIVGTTLHLKLKTAAFRTRTLSRRLGDPTQLADILYRHGSDLLTGALDGTAYRLIGIGLTGLEPAPGADPQDLIDTHANARARAERAIDKVRARFGSAIIVKGRSLKPGREGRE